MYCHFNQKANLTFYSNHLLQQTPNRWLKKVIFSVIIHFIHSFIHFSTAPEALDQLVIEVSKSHTHAHTHTHTQSVGLLWTSDQPVTETSTWQHTTLTRNRYPCPRRESNSQSQQALGRRPTPETARPLGSAIVILTNDKMLLMCRKRALNGEKMEQCLFLPTVF
jgi:hypothetical protein